MAVYRALTVGTEPPVELMIGRMCRTYGVLPMPGALLEQPWGLLLTADACVQFADAFHMYEEAHREKQQPPREIEELVMRVMAAAAS